jgi:hypothetical protein
MSTQAAGLLEKRSGLRLAWRAVICGLTVLCLVVLAWAGFAPLQSASRQEVFVIPKGTWAQRMGGKKLPLLPDEIYLTLTVRDLLVLENQDDVPQIFGPALIMPGQSFSLPFEVASDYQFMCTAHTSGQMTVIVHPYPASPWARLWWRARNWARLQHIA